MTFSQSIRVCLGPKYFFSLKGRAGRSEFWWFTLFVMLTTGAASLAFSILPAKLGASLSLILSLLLFPANFGVTARRLHDNNISAWWLLLPLGTLFLVGLGAPKSTVGNLLSLSMCLLYLALLCMPSQAKVNRFGPPPLER